VKKLIQNYSFDASSKTVTLNDYTLVNLEGLLLITNVTDNQIIYNFANPSLGALVTNNVITLTYNTASMNDNDIIQIFYDDGTNPASENTLQSLEDMVDYLKMIVQNTKVLSTQDLNQRQRVVVENTLTMPQISATTSSFYGELTVRQESSRLEFAQGIRNNLVF
jgi:hypothetical protein